MILPILMLLMYLIVSAATILVLRSRTLDILRVLAGIAFLLLATVTSLNMSNPASILTFALALCVFISVEITGFKQYRGDVDRLFMIHAFTIMLAAAYIIVLFTA
ncbi:membrane stabilizing protein MspA [Salinicoccus carnicancri]|uniref:membrane stabilizing protein MspA n=1 Tax=Salinicoccus carnicancri TaxID=558170 RepID=UPI0002E57F03|nr:membrane stabilizing protein MspA [Salinicoccus carnicancri]